MKKTKMKNIETIKKKSKTKKYNTKSLNSFLYGGNEEEIYKNKFIEHVKQYQENPSDNSLYEFLAENKKNPYFSIINIMQGDTKFGILNYILNKLPVIKNQSELNIILNIIGLFSEVQKREAFFFCCFYVNLYSVDLFLKNKLIDVNSVNDKGLTALGLTYIRILHYGKIDQIEESLKKNPTQVVDDTIQTLLKNPNREAEEELLTLIFTKLIECGADINQPFIFNSQKITIMDIQKQIPLPYQNNYINFLIFGILNLGTHANIISFKDHMLNIKNKKNSCKILNKLCPWFSVNTPDVEIKEYCCFIFLVLTLLNNNATNKQFTLLIKGRRAIQSCLRSYDLRYIQTNDIDVLVVPTTNSNVSSEWYAKNLLHFIYWILNFISTPYQIINTQVPESNIFKMSIKTPSGLIVSLCDISYGYNSIPSPIKSELLTRDPYGVRIEKSVYKDTRLNYGNGLIGLLTHQNIDELIFERFYYLYTYSTKEAIKNSKNRAFFTKLCKQLKEISLTVSPQNIGQYISMKLSQYKSKNIQNSSSSYSDHQLTQSIIRADI
jgi:hypothetical protein